MTSLLHAVVTQYPLRSILPVEKEELALLLRVDQQLVGHVHWRHPKLKLGVILIGLWKEAETTQ